MVEFRRKVVKFVVNIKNYFKDYSNICSFGIGLIPAILLYIFPSTTAVPFFVFIILLFLLLLSLWLCMKLLLDLKELKIINNHQISSPTLPIIECHHNVCICRPNNLIANNSLVTFYEKIRGYEQQIGYGYVENINSAGLAQIRVYSTSEDIPDLIAHINDNMEAIILRPTITLDTINSIQL